MKTNKGQAAFEYLMTYSWAILIVMVVGLAVYGFGVISGDNNSGLQTSAGFMFLRLIPSISEVNAGLGVFYFQNNNPGPITFNASQTTIVSQQTGLPCPIFIIGPQTVQSGEQVEVIIEPNDDVSDCINPNDQAYDLQFNFAYQTVIAGEIQTRSETGRVKGKQTLRDQSVCTKSDIPSPTQQGVYNTTLRGKTCKSNSGSPTECYIDSCANFTAYAQVPTIIPPGMYTSRGPSLFEYVCMPTTPDIRIFPILCPSGKCVNGACV